MQCYWLSIHVYLLFCRYVTHLIMACVWAFKRTWELWLDSDLIDCLTEHLSDVLCTSMAIIGHPNKWSLSSKQMKSSSELSVQGRYQASHTMDAPGLDSEADGAYITYWNALFVILRWGAYLSRPPIVVGHPVRALKPLAPGLDPLFRRFNKCFPNISNRSHWDDMVTYPACVIYEDVLSRPSAQVWSPQIIPGVCSVTIITYSTPNRLHCTMYIQSLWLYHQSPSVKIPNYFFISQYCDIIRIPHKTMFLHQNRNFLVESEILPFGSLMSNGENCTANNWKMLEFVKNYPANNWKMAGFLQN